MKRRLVIWPIGRRWIIWLLGIAALAVIGLFPLRTALGMSDFERIGFSARQVAGTIWYGRIGDLHLKSQPFGTFEVQLNPLPLLIGNISMNFGRLESPEGPLEGQLVAGFRRGVVDTSGRVVVREMFSPLPVEALELQDVTILFRNGRCAEASGSITPIVAIPVVGLQLDTGLKGDIECDGERARVVMTTPSGRERIDFYVQASGDYRGWMSIRNPPPAIGAGLVLFGFRPSPEGLSLSVDGRL